MTMGPDDPRHGSAYGYNSGGCRCDRCRRANADASARRRSGRPRLTPAREAAQAAIPRPGEWATRAGCRNDSSPDDWFVTASFEGKAGNARALRICQTACSVMDECRAHYEAMARPDRAMTIAGGVQWTGRGNPVGRNVDADERVERRRAAWRESSRRKAARQREARAAT